MAILGAAFATGAQHPYLGAFLMVVMGAVTFLAGFMQYRHYRLLADAPRAPVRSIPMGLVHVHGKASSDAPLTSPLTGTRCLMFVVTVREWVKTRTSKGGTRWSWQTVAGDDDMIPFYLDDGTGRVLVNPLGAENPAPDSGRTFSCEIGKDGRFKSVRPTSGFAQPNEQAVWSYIHGPHHRKLLEQVFAMQGERGRMMKSVMESSIKGLNVLQQVQSMGTRPRLVSMADGLEGFANPRPGGGPYRVTEECLLADSDCFILGTCAENSDAKREEDRHIIRQGENERTFLISSQGEAKAGRKLILQTFMLVFLGGGLIVGGFALALHTARML